MRSVITMRNMHKASRTLISPNLAIFDSSRAYTFWMNPFPISLRGLCQTSFQGVKTYALSVIRKRILSIGTIIANEKMLKTAERMFRTTDPQRYFLKGAMYRLIIIKNPFIVREFWSSSGR